VGVQQFFWFEEVVIPTFVAPHVNSKLMFSQLGAWATILVFAKFSHLIWNIQTNEVRKLGVGLRGVVTNFAIPMKEIPLTIKQTLYKKPMMIVIEYGHKQVFYFDPGGVARILNLGNDFGGSHIIV